MTLSQTDGRELGADVADVAVDGAVGHLDVELIGRAHDLLAAEHGGRPARKARQDAELERGQAKRRAAEALRHAAAGSSRELRLAPVPLAALWPLRVARRDPAQDDVDPRHQLARAERLGHVVVAADLEPEHAVDLLVAGGQEQDRHVGGLADLPADFEPVHLGHADIEDDQVGPVGGKARRAPALPSRASVTVMPALLSADADDFADMRVIVDGQGCGGSHVSPVRAASAAGLIWLRVEIALQAPAAKAPAAPGRHVARPACPAAGRGAVHESVDHRSSEAAGLSSMRRAEPAARGWRGNWRRVTVPCRVASWLWLTL